MIELEKAYDHTNVEEKIYKQWLDSGYFHPENLPNAENREPYTIIMPPPNVTGTLHIGHALMASIEDILVRFKRMQGRKALWLPGTDHAAIATQSKVEKLLEKEEGKRKTDLGREEFLKRVQAFAQSSHDTIVNQLKCMGASCDWEREAFTLDDQRNLAVRTAFKKMYDLGLIYRGHRVINWDVKGQTTISDDEVVYQERPAKLYTFKYSKDFPISISTTRPETKLGDTAVAVNPEDDRYREFVGKEYDLNFMGESLHIKIIADKAVEKDFGTGALGVTPAHSMIDAEMAQNHHLPMVQIIDERGRMIAGDADIKDKKTAEAREIIVQKLKEQGLIEKEEDITQNVATAERTGGIIEPLPKLQWFIDVNKKFALEHSELKGIKSGQETTLKELMRLVVESGEINITPDHFKKIYFHWVDNLRDWCISRQIWYGHRIPVWYKGSEIYVGINPPEGEGWTQDSDTLDTWFSSGLWTFSTLGWPKQAQDFKTYHPTSVMETGYDILFFWVARMILMTTSLTGQIPFKDVFLHGIIRDANRQKMSKSKGNVVDPLDMSAKYGTDALRFALVFNTAPGTDMALAEDKIKGMKHFGNKLWNIARFVMQNVNADEIGFKEGDKFTPEEDAILTELGIARKEKIASVINSPQRQEMRLIKSVTEDLENFRMHQAAQDVYDSLWHSFADKYIEYSKDRLLNGSEDEKRITKTILFKSLRTYLKLLHPFMPFITEHIWQMLREGKLVTTEYLMIAEWPR